MGTQTIKFPDDLQYIPYNSIEYPILHFNDELSVPTLDIKSNLLPEEIHKSEWSLHNNGDHVQIISDYYKAPSSPTPPKKQGICSAFHQHHHVPRLALGPWKNGNQKPSSSILSVPFPSAKSSPTKTTPAITSPVMNTKPVSEPAGKTQRKPREQIIFSPVPSKITKAKQQERPIVPVAAAATETVTQQPDPIVMDVESESDVSSDFLPDVSAAPLPDQRSTESFNRSDERRIMRLAQRRYAPGGFLAKKSVNVVRSRC